MADHNEAFIGEVREESKGEEEVDTLERGDGLDEEDEGRGPSPSHLPFAPLSELPDRTTIDPSYIISLIQKLLPTDASTQKISQNVSYSSSTMETHQSEERMDGKSNCIKEVADTEAINNGMVPDSRKYDTVSNAHETEFLHKENVWEDSGCILWDLSASRTHAEFMVHNYLLEVLVAILQTSQSPRITEICLGILGNLACHDTAGKVMASEDGLIETVVGQLYIDDTPCLIETFRLLAVVFQGNWSALWAKELLSEQTCLRIIWIVGNTLNPMLLEKGIEFLSTVADSKEGANFLQLPWIKSSLPNLIVNLLSSEIKNLVDENNQRTSFLDAVLCLVEALSASSCGSETSFPKEELCHLVCRVIRLPDKFEYTSARVVSVVIIANLLMDGPHIASQLSQDHAFIRDLLETIPLVSDDSQAHDALWWVLARLFGRFSEKDVDMSSLHQLASLFLEKSSLIMEDLDGHYLGDYSPNSSCISAVVRALLRMDCIMETWLARKSERIEDTSNTVDAQVKAERLVHYCKKYSSLLSTQNIGE